MSAAAPSAEIQDDADCNEALGTEDDAILGFGLPDISSLERFARTQDPSWRELDGRAATALLSSWAGQCVRQGDVDIPEHALLAALHVLQEQRPAQLMAAVNRALASCASLLTAKMPQGDRDAARQLLPRPLLVIVFFSTQCIHLPSLSSGPQEGLQQQPQHQAMLDAAHSALSVSCTVAQTFLSSSDAMYLKVLEAIGQVQCLGCGRLRCCQANVSKLESSREGWQLLSPSTLPIWL